MIRHDVRSPFLVFLRLCRRFRDAARRWTRTGNRRGLCIRAGGQRLRRFLEGTGGLSSGSDGAFRGGRRAAHCALPDRDQSQPVVGHPGGGVSASCSAGAHGKAARSGHDPQQLRVPNRHLVMADGDAAGVWGLGSQTAFGGRHFGARLEAFFRAASIADPAGSTSKLSAHYASLSELLSADPAIVADYSDEAAAGALAEVRSLMTWALEDELRQRRPIRCARDATALLKQLIGFRCDELLIVLFLDSGRGLIDHEVVTVGRTDSVDMDCRRILLRAIGRGAAGIIVAHNHPSGDPRPSSSDIRATRMLADVSRALGITLHDHLVVAGGEIRSAMFGSDWSSANSVV